MNSTHLHLLLNHFPIIGTLIGSGLLLWGIIKKQDNVKAIASVLLVLMAIAAIPVFFTGEPAEESVEKLPGVSNAMLELHEEAAEIAIWVMGITGLASLLALYFARQKRETAIIIYTIAFILSATSFVAMARTGYYGGQIRHTEIRSGNATDPLIEKANDEKEKVDKD